MNKKILSRRRLLVLISIIIALILTVILTNFITDYTASSFLSAKGLKPGMPEYSIEKFNFLAGVSDRPYNYSLKDDSLFVILANQDSKTNSLIGNAVVGVKDKDGNYNLSMSGSDHFGTYMSDSTDYIKYVTYFEYKGKTLLLYKSNQFNADTVLDNDKIIDNNKLEMVDNNGNILGKLTITGLDYVVFYDVIEGKPSNYAVYAVYNGNKIPITNAYEINGSR